MKKILSGILFLGLALVSPRPMMAGVNVDIHLHAPLPPPIVYPSPPELIVLPGTYVYVAPDIEADIFFYNGWWWRPWEGRWYRSHNYRSGWSRYNRVPSFYRGLPPDWRNAYRERRWDGHHWEHQRIPHQQLQRNWRNWERNRHWERQRNWGVEGFHPRHPQPHLKKGHPQHPQHPQPHHGNHGDQHGGKKGR